MTTLPQQIQTLKNNISTLRAMINGVRDQGKLYAIIGDTCIFGCKITQGSSASDLYLALEGEATGDEQHRNPDLVADPLRHEEYSNIALIYGEVFESTDSNVSDTANDLLLLDDAPATANYGRYDIVYAYVGQAGPAVSIATGTAAAAVKTDFTNNGLDTAAYPSTYDPALPFGTFPLARVYVQTGDTGIANARIADLRVFKSRMNPVADTGKIVLHTGLGLGVVNTAVRRFSTVLQNNCPGITRSDSSNSGTLFTVTQAGIYKFAYTDIAQSTTGFMGISINSNQLTTSVESANIANVGSRIVKTAQGPNTFGGRIETSIKLNIGDVVACHSTIGTWGAESNLTRLEIEKILDL